MKLLKIILKNLKILLRSKTSAFVIVLAPLLIIILVGMSFSTTSTYFLQIGVYSEKYSDLTNSFIETLNSETYSIQKYTDESSCLDDIRNGDIHTCQSTF